MNIDESTLLAYVDGELDARERDRVEAALAHDPGLRKQMDELRASCLPYQSAYAALATPEMPPSLESRVASLIAVADAAPTKKPYVGRQWLWAGAALAASFMLGLVAPTLIGKSEHTPIAQPSQGSATPWVAAIASYQALYVRATVDQAPDTAARAERVLAEFASERDAPAAALAVPNLQDAGLTFKRIQRLGYGDKPLLQMVYLPAVGKPAALCVLPLASANRATDSPLQIREIDGLAVASWQKDGMAYVLTADMPKSKAQEIARRIADGAFTTLYRSAS